MFPNKFSDMRYMVMREQKSVYRMTDRELRAYKRQQKRRKQLQRRICTMMATLCMIVVCAVAFHGIRSMASNGENQLKFKYYTQVTVAYGETLWDLSDSFSFLTPVIYSLTKINCFRIILIHFEISFFHITYFIINFIKFLNILIFIWRNISFRFNFF